MDENLSIDEIIKQAEQIRQRSVEKTHTAVEEVSGADISSGSDINDGQDRVIIVDSRRDDDVKIMEPVASKKTAVVDKNNIKSTMEGNGAQQHTRVVSINDKTGVVPSVKEFRGTKKSFFNNQGEEPLYSKNPPEIIEKPATIKDKSRFDNTGDLQQIPTIVAVDEYEKTRVSFNRAEVKQENTEEDDEDDGQIVLEGFEDYAEHKKVDKIDEQVAEQMLRERRRDKVNKFRVFSPDDVEEDNKKGNTVLKKEFESKEEKSEILNKLYDSKKATALSCLITLAFTIVLGGLELFKDSSFLPPLLMDTTPFIITCLVIYGVAFLFNIRTIIRGLRLKNGINSDFPISVMSIFVLVHTVLLLVNNDLYLDDGALYTLAACFGLLMSGLGRYQMLLRIINNFKQITTKADKYTIETIVNQIDAAIISKGLLMGEPVLKTSIKTDFPTSFLDISCGDEPADNIARVTGSVMMGLNVVLMLVISIINRSWHIGLNAMACGICISMPCISLFSTNNALYDLSRIIKKNGAVINGFEGAGAVVDANAIVIEAQDLFAQDSCEIHGIKTFNGAKADDVILQTAAVIINTKSPLAAVFDDVIIGKQTILPEVDGIVYEDKLGTSAWIYRKKVLVGTRELLAHHGVAVPKEDFESKYMRKGRKILYLAVAGRLLAMYVVSYNADPVLKKELRRLEKSGITILVKSADPFITDESIAELFNLPDGYVRVMNASSGRVFDKYSNIHSEKSSAYAVHNGTALGFVTAMRAAENIVETRKMLNVLISFGCVIGFGVVALLSGIGGFSQLGAISVIIFHLCWLVFTQVISKLKRLGL